MRHAADVRSRKAADEFSKKAAEIHGKGKYAYDEVEYQGANEKVSIRCLVCNKHFLQTPSHHLRGQGCSTCASKKVGNDKTNKAADEFSKKATEIHGKGKYAYDNVEYQGNKKKVSIRCLVCNIYFQQAPSLHLAGRGCPTCVNKTEGIVVSVLDAMLSPYGFTVQHMGYRNSSGIGKMDIRITKGCWEVFIEVDGGHHFGMVPRHYKVKTSKEVQYKDLEKHKRAMDKGIDVIRIDQEWVWNSHTKKHDEWAYRLKKTILKLESSVEVDVDDMFLSDVANKYSEHPCYALVREKPKP